MEILAMTYTRLRILVYFASVGLSLNPALLSAQTINDPTPIQGNMVTETAAGIAVRSANGGYGDVDDSPNRMAQKARANALISQYSQCRANARNYARTKVQKDAIRADCVRQYQPKFAKACVGGATTIAICSRLKSRGTIE
jgi:hypothetical protein